MAIELHQPSLRQLGAAVDALRQWQRDDAPMQLHPGDLGWQWRFGGERLAAAVRTWSDEGRVLALGFLDEPDVLRLAVDPDRLQDEGLARRLAGDVTEVLPQGEVAVEVTRSARLRDLLTWRGWTDGSPWTQLVLDLAVPLPEVRLRVEVAGPDRVSDRTAVQRAAFDSSTFSDELWRVMADGPLYRDGRCLTAYDDDGAAVAAVTVWSAGPGRPGLLEPLGVHRDHRGRGYGVAISVAAGAALREMGASSAHVCTPSANAGAVATYRSAGFALVGEARDLARV